MQVYTEREILGSKSGWYRPTPPVDRMRPTETMGWTMTDLYHTVQCLREGTTPLMSGEQAAHVIEIIEKGYQSARAGRVMELETTFQTYQF